MRLDLRTREKVVLLNKQGYTYKQIRDRLKEESINVTIKSLYLLVCKYRSTKSVVDRPRRSRSRLLSREHYFFIDNNLSANDELTTRQLYNLLKKEFPRVCISLSTIKRARHELGWVVGNARYCQLIREGNKEKRLMWCEKMIEENEEFNDVLFTDESSVMLETHRKKCYRRRGAPSKFKPRPKHPVKVHVWGGISKQGATAVAIFTGIMTATRYTQILDAALLPFKEDVFPSGFRFQQDNDPKHCARYTRDYFTRNDINWWCTPAESPDLNPIENVWGSMKEFLRKEYKPKGLEDLKKGIREFWKTLTPSVCTRYINHLHRVIPKVIEENGGPSGF